MATCHLFGIRISEERKKKKKKGKVLKQFAFVDLRFIPCHLTRTRPALTAN